MRNDLLKKVRADIEHLLKKELALAGIILLVAMNDNQPIDLPVAILESIEGAPLSGEMLLYEIKVIMSVLGKPWQCEHIINSLYDILATYQPTAAELAVLLVGIHVVEVPRAGPVVRKQATVKYIMERC